MMIKCGKTSDKKDVAAWGSLINECLTSRIDKDRLEAPLPGLCREVVSGAFPSKIMATDSKCPHPTRGSKPSIVTLDGGCSMVDDQRISCLNCGQADAIA